MRSRVLREIDYVIDDLKTVLSRTGGFTLEDVGRLVRVVERLLRIREMVDRGAE